MQNDEPIDPKYRLLLDAIGRIANDKTCNADLSELSIYEDQYMQQADILHSLLHEALLAENYAVAQVCLDHGCKLEGDETSDHGILADLLTENLKEDRPQIIQWLVEHGADVNRRGHLGYNPLHIASFRGYPRTAKVLLDHGADSDATTIIEENSTPLHLAAQHGHEEIVRLLLESGADLTIKTKQGLDAMEVAKNHDHLSIAKYLERWRHFQSPK